MPRGRPPGAKNKNSDRKPKKVSVKVFRRDDKLDAIEEEAYKLLDQVTKSIFPDLAKVEIDLAWRKGVPVDSDGKQLWLTKLFIKDEMNRQHTDCDAVVQINHSHWILDACTDDMKIGALDESLCVIGVKKENDGEIRLDENKRPVLGKRKPTSCFPENVKRHGLWNDALVAVVEAATEAEQRPLLAHPNKGAGKAKQPRAQA